MIHRIVGTMKLYPRAQARPHKRPRPKDIPRVADAGTARLAAALGWPSLIDIMDTTVRVQQLSASSEALIPTRNGMPEKRNAVLAGYQKAKKSEAFDQVQYLVHRRVHPCSTRGLGRSPCAGTAGCGALQTRPTAHHTPSGPCAVVSQGLFLEEKKRRVLDRTAPPPPPPTPTSDLL